MKQLVHCPATGSNIVFVVDLSVYFYWEDLLLFFSSVCAQYSTCAVSFAQPPSPPSPLLQHYSHHLCWTSCGHIVQAYDGSWSVTADVAGPICTINKCIAAMACCEVHSLPKQALNSLVWSVWESTGFLTCLKAVMSLTPKNTQEFTLPVSRLKPQSLFNSFST